MCTRTNIKNNHRKKYNNIKMARNFRDQIQAKIINTDTKIVGRYRGMYNLYTLAVKDPRGGRSEVRIPLNSSNGVVDYKPVYLAEFPEYLALI